jgi:hypothetical protein
MTKSSPDGTIKTFATLRIMGDQLDPDEITQLLKIKPTTAYAKGDRYEAGHRTGSLVGKTGVWLFSTDRGINSFRLADHLMVLLYLLIPDFLEVEMRSLKLHTRSTQKIPTFHDLIEQSNLRYLRGLLQRKSLTASVCCFWHGKEGAKPPAIPRGISSLFRLIPITIEADFDTDDEHEPLDIAMRA